MLEMNEIKPGANISPDTVSKFSGITRTVTNFEEEKNTDHYQMESSLFDFEEVRRSENFGIKVFNNAVFKGIIINGSRNGNGIMIYNNS